MVRTLHPSDRRTKLEPCPRLFSGRPCPASFQEHRATCASHMPACVGRLALSWSFLPFPSLHLAAPGSPHHLCLPTPGPLSGCNPEVSSSRGSISLPFLCPFCPLHLEGFRWFPRVSRRLWTLRGEGGAGAGWAQGAEADSSSKYLPGGLWWTKNMLCGPKIK